MSQKNKKQLKPAKQVSVVKSSERIKRLRNELALGVRELARAIKSSPSSVCCWEKGKRAPNVDACYRLIELARIHGIDITIEWLRPN